MTTGFQPVPNTAEFEAHFALGNGQSAQFALYANIDVGSWGATELNGVRDDFADAIIASYMPVVCDAHSFLGVTARDLETEFGRVSERTEAAPVFGDVAGPSLPANVAPVVKLFCDIGPPRQGRVFLLPPTEGQAVGDRLEAAAQTALQAAMQAVFNAIDGNAGVAVVAVSRYSGTTVVATLPSGKKIRTPNKRTEGVVANISSVAVQSLLGSQRRRHTRSG